MKHRVPTVLALGILLAAVSMGQVPSLINYQGRVFINNTNFTGTGQFKFALVDGAGSRTFWSNDGTGGGEPASSVPVTVSKGLYSVLLGQSPMAAISPAVFTNTDVRLRVWFDSGTGIQRLIPDQRIGAVGYALVAATVTNGAIDSTKLSADAGSLAKVSGGALAASGANIGIGTGTPQRALHLEREMLIKGNDGTGAEYTDWPYASLSIRRSDDFVDNGVSMLSLGYRNDPIYVMDDSVANIRLYDPQQASNAPTSSATTQLRIASPGPVVLQPSGGKVGIGTVNPAEQLEVAGRLVIADSANASPKAGTIRWTGTDFQGYNGQQWQSLTAPAPAGMVLVPGGTFTMGSSAFYNDYAEATNDYREHQVTLSSFYLSRCEVPYALWYSVRQWATNNGYVFQNAGREGNRGTNGSLPTASSAQPVTFVNWRDCIVWCNARSEKEGLQPVYTYANTVNRDSRDANATACDNAVFNTTRSGYRLPTEAEWEFAARYADGVCIAPGDFASGGGYSVYGLDTPGDPEICDAAAWYWKNSSNTTHVVGSKKVNQLGAFDMSGNVREWCWDWYGAYNIDPATNPIGPASGTSRMDPGGCYGSAAFGLMPSRRAAYFPSRSGDDVGFRCARNTQ